jgi:hypothetical protein
MLSGPLKSIDISEVTFSSETSADFQRTTRRYIPEGRTLHNHRCENLRSYIIKFIPRITHRNNTCERAQIKKVLIMQFSPVSDHFLFLGPSILLSELFSNTLNYNIRFNVVLVVEIHTVVFTMS